MNLKKSLLGVSIAAAMSLASAAHAVIVIPNITIDFTSVGGPVVLGVDAIGFNDAPFVARNNFDGTFSVSGKGAASSLLDDFNGNVSPAGFGQTGGFELTFDFNLKVAATISGSTLTFTHLAGPSALRFYLDDLDNANADGGVKATPGNGTGYTDGTLVLTFDVLAMDGGVVLFNTLDGSDDAVFEVSQVNTPGIFKTSAGNEFEVGYTLAITDSNFDLDSNNNNVLDETRGGFGCTTTNQIAGVFFCGVEDGTVRFAVPEPGTLAIMGLGLLGLGLMTRRKVGV